MDSANISQQCNYYRMGSDMFLSCFEYESTEVLNCIALAFVYLIALLCAAFTITRTSNTIGDLYPFSKIDLV